VLAATALAVIVAAVAFVRDPTPGVFLAAVAIATLPALPLWWRWHRNTLRLSAGLIGAAVTILSLWALTAGGFVLLPTGLLLLATASRK
jgi:hypothetical protein